MRKRLRDARKRKDLSQSDLGALIGVSQNTVTAWETGKKEPTLSNLILAADALDVSLDYLAGRTEVPFMVNYVSSSNGYIVCFKSETDYSAYLHESEARTIRDEELPVSVAQLEILVRDIVENVLRNN